MKITSIDKACLLDILDTAGQGECDYAGRKEGYLRTRDGYLLVIALDDERSFDGVFDNFRMQIIQRHVSL